MKRTKTPEQIAQLILALALTEEQSKQAWLMFEYSPQSALRYCKIVSNKSSKIAYHKR